MQNRFAVSLVLSVEIKFPTLPFQVIIIGNVINVVVIVGMGVRAWCSPPQVSNHKGPTHVDTRW
jgi:hypothetical protein